MTSLNHSSLFRIVTSRSAIAFLCTVLGIGIGIVINSTYQNTPRGSDTRDVNNTYQFINPLLACGDDNFSRLQNDRQHELESKMNDYFTLLKSRGDITDGALYFKELNGGQSVDINEDATFTPGSLLKVPLVMSVYQYAEKNPNFLANSVEFAGGSVPATEHFTAPTIKVGNTYTVEQLAEVTLEDSDNNAAQLLTQLIPVNELDDAYSSLGITIPSNGQDYLISVKDYASFFRLLYNATYISHDNSEHLLKVLSGATFKDGLVAGVPSGTMVAHKFGERSLEGQSGVQLHDCGIVYSPKQPYLICVMLRGSDFNTLAQSIAGLSKLAYDYAE